MNEISAVIIVIAHELRAIHFVSRGLFSKYAISAAVTDKNSISVRVSFGSQDQ